MSTQILNAVTTTGAGSSIVAAVGRHVGEMPSKHSVEVAITGSPTAVVIALEGSIAGSNYSELAEYTLTAADLSAGYALFHVVERIVGNVRANVKTLTGGTSPTVSAWYEGGR